MLQRLMDFVRHVRAKPVQFSTSAILTRRAASCRPVSPARWKFWLRGFAPGSDIKLQPLALTVEQVLYKLPPIPIKERRQAAKHFQERYGVDGATELDALEALHPGGWGDWSKRRPKAPYRDSTLSKRMDEAGQEARKTLNQVWRERQEEDEESFEDRLENIQGRTESILESFKAGVESLADRLAKRIGKPGLRMI